MDDKKLERLERALDNLSAALSSGPSGNQSTISINAGGTAVWLVTTACAVMLAVNVLLFAVLMNHDRKIDRLSDYLSAIYALGHKEKPSDDSYSDAADHPAAESPASGPEQRQSSPR